jgi:hypothetical protein
VSRRPAAQSAGGRHWTRWWVAMVPVALALAALVWLAVVRARPAVAWPEVLEAAGERETVHGVAQLYLMDGSEWQYALWARIGGPGVSSSEGMLLQVRPAPGEEETPGRLSEELQMLCRAMDYCGEAGIVTRLARGPENRTPARREAIRGKPVLMVDLAGESIGDEEAAYPDRVQVYVDPDTMLVSRLKLFMVEAGGPALRGLCDYRYDEPLPPGFGESKG